MTAGAANPRGRGGWCSSGIGWQKEGAAQKQRSAALRAQKLPAEIAGSEAEPEEGTGLEGRETDGSEGERLREGNSGKEAAHHTYREAKRPAGMRTEREETGKAKKYK